MTLSVDDEITLVEVVVVLIGIAITWAVYRSAGDEGPVADRDTDRDRGTESPTDPEGEGRSR